MNKNLKKYNNKDTLKNNNAVYNNETINNCDLFITKIILFFFQKQTFHLSPNIRFI